MSEFKIPPISTLIGSHLVNFYRVLQGGSRIAPEYFLKLMLSAFVVIISIPFHVWEHFYFLKKVKNYRFEKAPLFILGHWRSGTTFLHNMLCAAPGAGYLTTYHSVFPNNLASKFIFRNFMKMNMPEKRPTDNVKLGIDLPQEDEFALSNLTTSAFYHFFYFPERYRNYYRESIEEVNDGKHPAWDNTYRKLIVKALLNSHGRRAVIKNPVNTARIKSLLRIFPDAKFIFIYRNPVTVFLSTQKFFDELLPTLWFKKVSKEFIDEMIYDNFNRLMNDYYDQKHLIPSHNLLEIKFEDFEKDPLFHCSNIYSSLLDEDFEPARQSLEQFLSSQKGYVKNKYPIEQRVLTRIEQEWGVYMKKWGYNLSGETVSTDQK